MKTASSVGADTTPEPQQFSLFEAEPPAAAEEGVGAANPPQGRFSNFVVYVDESGDHGLQTLDPNYPVFVLAFCVFYKRHYSEKVVPALHKLKFNHFGHDLVVLHEHEIRKEKGAFKFANRQHKQQFLSELTDIIEISNFILISCVIDKKKLRDQGKTDGNPYHLALGFCLETLYELLQEKNQDGALTHVIVECRGKKEDNELELEFRRICDGANRLGITLPFDIVFADKKVDSPGLQLADLVARPVGMHVLRPEQENRAFEVLKRKFFCSGGREKLGEGFEDWGLKMFPPPESEKPR
ncbi:DUF3800 domain-containing protein [Ralstonia pickettii]|jgi:Protein of unknown function (DUF3800)|uniref:DUF3800 domain-containing protein n=3 Tax=Pseudomonadota TaxID=1224 RepID=A0ABM9IVL3_RALPI|nr:MULTISPECIES: DUF3800 domain-containing protein [Ralstonia]MBA4234218.1 DUF3800 domain-containing protein [Ralstonia sp.]MBA4239065.1 DUF3800 domain-containing protein [Ralstonia sp.]POH87448.1 DUF3800 domain-containing protein [Ralstonia pickettii]CAJ0732922.1 hypothetical protein R38712_05128 [Ralstonia pickettii]